MNVRKVLKKIDDFLYQHIGRTRILFEVSNAYGWACQKPVYDQLKKISAENGLYLATTTIDERKFDIFDEFLEEGLYENPISIDRARWMKWHYIIHTDISGIYFYRNSINVMMLHGAAYGTVKSNYNAKMFLSNDSDLYLGLSENEWQYIKRDIDESVNYKDKLYIPVGFPKADRLMELLGEPKDYLTYEMDRNKKTVMICSHWTETAFFMKNDVYDLVRLIESFRDKYNFIITGHEKFWESDQGKDAWDILMQQGYQHSNVLLIRNVDIYRLMPLCDLFVTDHSSITIDCSMFNRPILFFDDPSRVFNSEAVLNLYRDACYSIKSMHDVHAFLNGMDNFKDSKGEGRVKLRNNFFPNVGGSSAYAAHTIIKFGRLPVGKANIWREIAKNKGIKYLD